MDDEDLDTRTKRQLHRWMAGGRLSRAERDVIRESVLDEVARREGRARGKSGEQAGGAKVIRVAKWAGTALATAAAVLLVVRVGVIGGGAEPDVGTVQYEEGEVGSGETKIAIRCADGTLEACPVGSSLVFAVSGNRKRVMLSAWAERVGAGAGAAEAVFYFEKDGGGVEIAAAGAGARAVERTVRLAPGHVAGRYRVHAFVADRVLGREEMRERRGGEAVGGRVRVEVVIVE